MSKLTRPWLDRWLIVTNEGIGYITKNDLKHTSIREYNFYPRNFRISLLQNKVMIIKRIAGAFEVRITNPLKLLDLFYGLLVGFNSSQSKQINPHDSFCKVFEGNDVRFFTNGAPNETHYLEEVYKELFSAEKEILINDWYFSPEIYLRRPIEDFPESRFDWVLTEKAQKGVKIFIILYREIEEIMYNNSARVKDYLESCHPNIHVVRHPSLIIRISNSFMVAS